MMMTLPTFRALCAQIPYRPKGIFYSEMFLFLRACSERFVTTIIESGVKHGGSTQVLAATFPGTVVSVDRSFLKTFLAEAPARVRLERGDACEVLPRLLQEFAGESVGVLIDGPKQAAAIRLKDACLRHRCVKVVAIHDLAPGHGESRHSQDPTWRQYYGADLDRLLLPPGVTKKYPKGPGLAVWGCA